MNIQKLHISPSTPLKAAAAALILLAIAVSLTAYPLPAQAQTSTDATLSALTVSPRDIIGFSSVRFAYDVGVASTATEATITATATNSNADVSFDTPDSNDMTDGHQVALSAGRNEVTITVTAENGSDEQDYTVNVNRGVTIDYGWNAEHDLDGLIAAENEGATGVWSNGTTFWVVDYDDGKIYAYNADGTHDSANDFNTLTAAGNTRPLGLWSDEATMWVTQENTLRIYAYNMGTKAQDTTKEFNTLATENIAPQGIWSNGITMWVADVTRQKIFAYRMSDQMRLPDSEFDTLTDASNTAPNGIWSNGTTMWVTDRTDSKVYAYQMSDRTRDASKDFSTLIGAGNANTYGVWSDGATMWVTDHGDDKVYSYNMPPRSTDATLSALTVSPEDIIGFASDRTSYEVGVASTVTEATIAPTATYSNAEITYSTTDADIDATGHQVTLSPGKNTVTVTVTAEDTTTTQTYTVNINRAVTADYGWNAEHDLDGLVAAGNNSPNGIWGNSSTIWVADLIDNQVYAYNRDGSPDTTKGFDLHTDNTAPIGAWSNGTIVWITDFIDRKLYAYEVSSGTRQSNRDIDFDADNNVPRGLWSDGTTVWVGDLNKRKLYAHLLADGMRQESRDITFDLVDGLVAGTWSDGATMWLSITTGTAEVIYAYSMADGSRTPARDFTTVEPAGVTAAGDLWSDGETLWQGDSFTDKVFAFNMPPNTDGTLSTITVAQGTGTPAEIAGFYRLNTDYTVTVDTNTAQVTVAGTARRPGATGPVIMPADAGSAPGHQVNVPLGNTPITFEVTAEDGSTTTYTVTVARTAVPVAPTNFAAGSGDTEAHLSWNNPNDASITHYQYRYRLTTSSSWTRNWTSITGSGADTTSHTITGLRNGDEYTIELRAVNSVDNGPASTDTVTPRIVPTAPGAPRSLRVAESDETLTLEWNRPSSNGNAQITSYTVQYKLETASELEWETAPDRTSDPAALTHQLSGLDNGLVYQVRVAAVNSVGPGQWTNSEGTPNAFYRPPDPPRNLALAAGDRSITATWNTPAHNGNGRITAYLVEYRREGEANWRQVTGRPATSTTRRQEISGLDNFGMYDVRVRARNQYGDGRWAEGSGSTWNTPTQATNLVASSENGALRISWGSPERDGGLPTTYEVHYQPAGSRKTRLP